MKQHTKKCLESYAATLPPSASRAQCYKIANLALNGGTIADAIYSDHASDSHALRAMKLVVAAGAAIEEGGMPNSYGTFVFEDGSKS